jgi:large subunit ribosomal protein L18e
MPKPTGPTDPNTNALIVKMRKKKEKFYLELARQLSKPARQKKGVNVTRIEKTDSHSVVVPGKVLGAGEITKPVTVYALHFSKEAKKKITAAGGKCLPLEHADSKARVLL